MEILFENAKKNSECSSKHANRYDITVETFASSLYCLIGKNGYELLLANLGSALPSRTSIQRTVASRKKIREDEFGFDELSDHLKDFDSPRFVNIHLNDTRIIHRIVYEQIIDRFVGFCLPLKERLPLCDAFVFQTFNEMKAAFNTVASSQYMHIA